MAKAKVRWTTEVTETHEAEIEIPDDMDPADLTGDDVAEDEHVDVTRVNSVVNDRTVISAKLIKSIPWKGAETHKGVIPQQESLYPRPVVLDCQECDQVGYWYPGENKIHIARLFCLRAGPQVRMSHEWAVYSWNGNEPVEAPLSGKGEDKGNG